MGPDLTNEAQRNRSRAWLLRQLDDPTSHDSASVMPSFASLSAREHNALVDYLMSLGTDDTSTTTRGLRSRPARPQLRRAAPRPGIGPSPVSRATQEGSPGLRATSPALNSALPVRQRP